MSRDIPFQAVKLAEECSKFSRQSGLSVERVVYSYRTVRCSDGFWHILSCLRDAGTDYSGRTNHLAQHLMFDSREASACAWEGKTPAGVILGTAWPDHDGFCGWIEDGVHWDAHEPEPNWQWWQAYAGSGDCRRNLSSDAALRGAVFVYGRGLESQTAEDAKKVLFLYAESQADCPEHGWGVTFTTSLEPNDELSEFRWIGVAENSPMLPKAEAAGGRVRVTFDTPPPPSRQPEATRAHSGVREPDASRVAVLQQQNYETAGEGVDSKEQGSSAKPPPLGPRTPPRPVPRAHERAVSGWVKDRQKYLAFAVVLLLAVVAGSFLVHSFLAPTEVSFQPDSLVGTYSLGKTTAAVLEQPPNGLVSYSKDGSGSWSTNPPSEAGDYDLKVEIPRSFGLPPKVVVFPTKLKITPVTATISFTRTNLEVTSEDGITKKQVVPTEIIPPEARAGSVTEYRKSETNQRGENTYGEWTTNAFGMQGTYEARVTISGNYEGVGQTGFSIRPAANQMQGENEGESASEGAKADPADGNAAGSESSATSSASDIRFLLADKTQMFSLLTNSIPESGDLYVYTKQSSKWLKVDREQGKRVGASWDEPPMFKMQDRIPVSKEADFGPLVYVVGSSEAKPDFVAIELQKGDQQSGLKGDNSGSFNCLFKEVRLQNVSGKPFVRFVLTNGTEFVGIANFETSLSGERFFFEYSRDPVGYNESRPLKVVLAPSGEIDLREEIAKQDALVKVAEKQAEASLPQVTSQDYFTRAKESFLAPLVESAGNTNTNNANPIAQQLYPVLKKLTPPAAADGVANKDVSKKSLAEVNHIIVETLVALTKDPTAYGLIDLTSDRKSRKSQNEQSGSGSFDPSLLDPAELNVESLKNKNIQGVVDRAKKWIDGREGDIHSNAFKEEEKKRAKLLKLVLDDLRKGLNNLKEIGPQRVAVAPPDRGTAERERKAAEAKLAFLTKLQDGGPFDNEQGRLLLCIPANGTAPAVEYILWPNVSLKSASQ